MKYFCSIAVILILFSCQHVERPEKPENLISQETMVSLLTEVYLGNAARSIDNKHIREQGIKLDSFLFAKYNVDSLQFAKSNAYYTADLDTYNDIISKVQQRLQVLKKNENERKLEENAERKAAQDSLVEKQYLEAEIDTAQARSKSLIESVTSEQEEN
ncbi:MAG TPA: DUF4296 domain-containing protein [Flavobacteriaceae bacterium]|jgi:hypothetical protein|nr:DUF4296 domain-containing protein [Flavobacteriaceae bacterium]HIN98026.1 DUF4296 domain-containing protein [Flavobacteriaceae bacterium]|tara:strand:+ start:174585 stop:175061 length:477 start_codon:yes stop_codon:yes gene_type:complete